MNPSTTTYCTRVLERHILAVYNRATDTDISTGLAWYRNAYIMASRLHSNPFIGAGVLAAFSPQMSWKHNLELASRAIESKIFTGHYPRNNDKAERIFNGEAPLDVLGGNKVRAFYECIVTLGDCANVVIDRHAYAIAYNETFSDEARPQITPKHYRTLAKAYRNVAARVGLRPSDLQAITWVAWRREHGITD